MCSPSVFVSSRLARSRRASFLTAAAINNLLGSFGSTPSGDLNPTCFSVAGLFTLSEGFSLSTLILRLVASRLRLRLRGPEGLPCCRCVGLSCCSWLVSLRLLLDAGSLLRLRLRSSRVRSCVPSLRAPLGSPSSMSDLGATPRLCFRLRGPEGLPRRYHCSALSLRSPSLRLPLGALSLGAWLRSVRKSSRSRSSAPPGGTRRRGSVSFSSVRVISLVGLTGVD